VRTTLRHHVTSLAAFVLFLAAGCAHSYSSILESFGH
jgi:hypothetical protein